MKGRAFIATSGWSYEHWRGVFYPMGLKTGGWLPYYMEHFDTVEVNNTFYRLPSASAFVEWKKLAPEGFVYALKATRFITHMKKLKDPGKPLSLFMERAHLLGNSLGPVLFQLPPRWRCNPKRLEEFLGSLPSGQRFAFEFRDPSWFNREIYALLRENRAALCIYHMPEFTTPLEVTADFVYMRFHGTDFLYGGRYSKKYLLGWSKVIRGYLKKGLDAYVYFNNDACAYAVVNARELKDMVG